MPPSAPAALVTLAIAVSALAVHAQDSRWIAWIRENHHAIRQPASTPRDDDFADLQFLKDVIGDRRIVQIGESHHSVAEYGAVKTRLIKFLHQEMGFDVLAFESSIYECFAANLRHMAPDEALFSTIFSVWAFEELLSLFEYLTQSYSTPRPLTFAGFDPQISSRTGVTGRPAFLHGVLSMIDAQYAREVAQFDAQFIDRIQREGPAYAREEEHRLVAFYTRLSDFPGTMERLLSDAGSSQLFVDLLNQPPSDGTRWMFEPMLSRDATLSGPQAMLPVLIVPRDQYDGLLFIDRVTAPRFLSR